VPEGHTIHRIARTHRRHFAGRPVAVSSPQGRFGAESRVLDGRVLEDVEAAGKHLFYHWADAPSIHVHLGLIGKFRTYREPELPGPGPQTRLVLATDGVAAHLTGPMTCRLIDSQDVDGVVAALGPDPLAPNALRSTRPVRRFADALAGRRLPVAAALLDQGVIAGVGNVYRSEILFLCGIHPLRPAASLADAEVGELWASAVHQLRHGVRLGRIVTVDPADVGARSRRAMPEELRLYVYKRAGEPCRRCGTPITSSPAGGRTVWWCSSCQHG
jgi:endonuclease-8